MMAEVSSSSRRKFKFRSRISCEEFNEWWFKGLCLFCGEQETPIHNLKHKGARLLIIDSDEDLSAKDVERIANGTEAETNGKSDTENLVKEEDTLSKGKSELCRKNKDVIQSDRRDLTVVQDVTITEESLCASYNSALTDSFCARVSIHEDYSTVIATATSSELGQGIKSIEVPLLDLEPNHLESYGLGMNRDVENCDSEVMSITISLVQEFLEESRFINVESRSLQDINSPVANQLFVAYKVFDKMLTGNTRLQKKRLLGLFPNSWMFKFKNRHIQRDISELDQYQRKMKVTYHNFDAKVEVGKTITLFLCLLMQNLSHMLLLKNLCGWWSFENECYSLWHRWKHKRIHKIWVFGYASCINSTYDFFFLVPKMEWSP